MFITVSNVSDHTEKEALPTRVNVNRIYHYNVSGSPIMTHGKVTCISFQGESYIEVLETPEEIDQLIEDVLRK